MQFLIRADQPFNGQAQSVLNKDGTVAYTDGLTIEEYEKERGYKVRVVSEDEMMELSHDYEESLITKPKRITKDNYWYALEVLPPCRWHNVRGIEVFHVSERLTGDLVAWYACINEKYYEWTDRASISDEMICNKLSKFCR